MSKSLEQQIIDELKPGERLIWQGRPASRRGKQRKTEHTIVTLLILGGLLGLIGVIAVAASNLGAAFCLALGFVVGVVNTVRERRSAPYRFARTRYALTDRRVFIIRDYPPGRRVDTMPLQLIGKAAVAGQKPDGRGTIMFNSNEPGPFAQRSDPLMFHMVEDVTAVLDLVERARRQEPADENKEHSVSIQVP